MIVIIITNIFTNVVEGNTLIPDAMLGKRTNATSVPKKDDIGNDVNKLPYPIKPQLLSSVYNLKENTIGSK